MADIWILVANSSHAALMSATSATAPLNTITTFDNPDARAKTMDLTSDRPGRSFDSQGEGRHAMEVEVTPKQQEQIRFAKLLSDYLEEGRNAQKFQRLVVIASPAFLGVLRPHFGAPLSSLISLEVDKDYTSLTPEALRARLPLRL